MHLISIYLPFVALSDIVETVGFHCQLVVTYSEDFLFHCMSVGMGTKRSFMDFFDENINLMSIYTYEKNHIIVSFVYHFSI